VANARLDSANMEGRICDEGRKRREGRTAKRREVLTKRGAMIFNMHLMSGTVTINVQSQSALHDNLEHVGGAGAWSCPPSAMVFILETLA
jgi:hypothetical protein